MMDVGRANLCRETGRDFGYDLRTWHDYLVESEFAGAYAAGPAWREVWAHLQAAMHSRDRERLVALAEARGFKGA